jgi:uncharacterized protein YegP (UPF0339 family)
LPPPRPVPEERTKVKKKVKSRLESATFIIYRDFDSGYRWRLRSGEGATMASGSRGHHDKLGCARDIEYRNPEVAEALVRDATVWGLEKQPLSVWLASQRLLGSVS